MAGLEDLAALVKSLHKEVKEIKAATTATPAATEAAPAAGGRSWTCEICAVRNDGRQACRKCGSPKAPPGLGTKDEKTFLPSPPKNLERIHEKLKIREKPEQSNSDQQDDEPSQEKSDLQDLKKMLAKFKSTRGGSSSASTIAEQLEKALAKEDEPEYDLELGSIQAETRLRALRKRIDAQKAKIEDLEEKLKSEKEELKAMTEQQQAEASMLAKLKEMTAEGQEAGVQHVDQAVERAKLCEVMNTKQWNILIPNRKEKYGLYVTDVRKLSKAPKSLEAWSWWSLATAAEDVTASMDKATDKDAPTDQPAAKKPRAAKAKAIEEGPVSMEGVEEQEKEQDEQL